MAERNNLNKTIAEYRKNFYKVYHSAIIPIFREFEKERKKRLKKLFIYIPLCVVLLIIENFYLLKCWILNSDAVMFLFVIVGLTFALTMFLLFSISYNFTKELKNACMPKLLPLFGNISWYSEIDVVSNLDLDNSSLFSDFNRRSSDDCFCGSYNGVKYTVSETELLKESGSGKNRSVTTIFKGVVINFFSNKTIANKTIVATKGDNNIKVIGNATWIFFVVYILLICITVADKWNSPDVMLFLIPFIVVPFLILFVSKLHRKREEKLCEIKLEDPEFSKRYRAFSSDQVEGRYLITPAFMERFKNIQTAFGADKVKCSFFDNNLMFAISTRKNLFEIGNLFYSLENPKQLETFFNELTSIFMLIDYFKLNEKTGL